MCNYFKRIYKIIKNPYKIVPALGSRYMLKWLPDDIYLKMFYRGVVGRKLNLNDPLTYNDKLQWLKLHNRNPIYTKMVDKFEVRNYIAKTIGEEYLIPLLGVWKKFDDIDFDKLPNQFVLKCTHDSGGIVICKDKSKFNITDAKRKINKSMKRNFFYFGREWPYKNVIPRIICEEYMIDESGTELKDYKIMCFNGEPKVIQVMSGRKNNQFYINHFDIGWNKLNIHRKSHDESPIPINTPKNLDEMIKVSKELSENIPFLRVDLYLIDSNVFFGEMTFFPVSGFMDFEEFEDDFLLGGWIKLPTDLDK